MNSTAIAPATPAPPPVFIRPVQFPSVSSVPSVVKTEAPPRPEIELIHEPGGPGLGHLVAVILPRPVSQEQLLIAEHLVRDHFRLRIDLSLVWEQWRVYASPLWHPTPEACQPNKPTGPKLFFA